MSEPLRPIDPDALRRACPATSFAFTSTEELTPLDASLGQARAVEALRFGVAMRGDGYNIIAVGADATGKGAIVRELLAEVARDRPTPSDYCYVHNFEDARSPIALELPASRGVELTRDVAKLIEEARASIPAVFEGDDYRTRRQAIDERVKREQEQAIRNLRTLAREQGIAILPTPMGIALAPMRDGEVMDPEEFEKLPVAEREAIEEKIDALQEPMSAAFRAMPRLERERREQMRALDREFTALAVQEPIDALVQRYATLPAVVRHLEAVRADIIERGALFLAPREHERPEEDGEAVDGASLRRYEVNVIIDHSGAAGAPVVYEDNPTLANLLGRVEHRSQLGALLTDLTLIRAGALHRARGGYLVLDARRLLREPLAWDALKRALSSARIRIESAGEILNLISTVSLEPAPIPLEIKVVLLGDRMLHALLDAYDPDVDELFKVVADFEDDTPRGPCAPEEFPRLVAALARRHGLRPFDASAVGRLIERSARRAGDSDRLSTHVEDTTDLMREGEHFATAAGRAVVTAEDIIAAERARVHRLGRVRERLREEINHGAILIATRGAVVGQINGLAVYGHGTVAFGKPTRITARVRLGRGGVIDIEREVKLGGPLHSKGVLILQGFLAARYALDVPLTLSASLVLEQSYGGVEGDSASLAEACALLSAIAELPIRQELAVTGSINQRGEVQPIGGVNEKIEGFHEVCVDRGMAPGQGVLIPPSNVRHLMLADEVVASARAGAFSVFTPRTVDEALELLTGVPAGARDVDGRYPEGSFNRAVEDRLIAFARSAAAFGRDDAKDRQ
ncbi:MAG: AAA family ATPase [Myxococcales bacterium]|nr:AAA family ATPase [Myxococcales bacterium]